MRFARQVVDLAGGATKARPAAKQTEAVRGLSAALERSNLRQIADPATAGAWARYLADRLPADGPLERQFDSLQLDDLFLCFACSVDDEHALRTFHASVVPVIDARLRALRIGDDLRRELKQELLVRLLVGDESTPPLLARYSGLGRLSSWLSVVVRRAARKRLHKEKRLVLSDDDRLEKALVAGHDCLPGLKASYRKTFKRAFKAALTDLSTREANMLRYRYVDSLPVHQVAAIYRVHESTIHRRLAKLKERLLEATCTYLSIDLAIPRAECSTIIRMIRSDFDMTLRSFFGTRGRRRS